MQEPIRIILIEDDDIDAESIERAFQSVPLPSTIHRFRNGEEALRGLRGGEAPAVTRPYLILLDLAMPRMNGVEFLEELRGDPHLSKSVVFVITTSENEQDVAAAYQRHVAGYILKTNQAPNSTQLAEMLSSYWRHVELLREVHP